jgi:hypothetical protein
MATIVTRAGKGAPLTHTEVDANFTNLNDLKVEQTGATGAAVMPVGTDAQRPTAATGYLRYNTDQASFEGYNGTAWGSIGGADFSSVADDIIPDADSTRDIGSTSNRWAQGWFDDVTSANTSDGTLSIPTTYVTNGSAKAWVNFDGTGTIAARDSFNLSSLTDNGTGDYTANWTNAMGNANYCAPVASGNDVLVSNDNVRDVVTRNYATGSIRLIALRSDAIAADQPIINVATLGDIA